MVGVCLGELQSVEEAVRVIVKEAESDTTKRPSGSFGETLVDWLYNKQYLVDARDRGTDHGEFGRRGV